MAIQKALTALLKLPSPESVWNLRAEILDAGREIDPDLSTILSEYYEFLDEIEKSCTAREYSNLASKLDIGAVGAWVFEDVLTEPDREMLSKKLLGALFSEGLMILATRQHVRAWEEELRAVYRRAAWYLFDQVWKFSLESRPELEAAKRRQLLEKLFRPILADNTDGEVKAVVCGRLFQILLLWKMSRTFQANNKMPAS